MGNPVSDLAQAICWRRAGHHMSNLDATARIIDYVRTVLALSEPLTATQLCRIDDAFTEMGCDIVNAVL